MLYQREIVHLIDQITLRRYGTYLLRLGHLGATATKQRGHPSYTYLSLIQTHKTPSSTAIPEPSSPTSDFPSPSHSAWAS